MRTAQNARSAKRQVAILVLPTITFGVKVISALAARVFMIVTISALDVLIVANAIECHYHHLLRANISLLLRYKCLAVRLISW